jgi:hypothetical protein
MSKLTWENVYEHFKSVYPKLGKMSTYFCPDGYMSIKVLLDDGTKMIYDDLKKQARIVGG